MDPLVVECLNPGALEAVTSFEKGIRVLSEMGAAVNEAEINSKKERWSPGGPYS